MSRKCKNQDCDNIALTRRTECSSCRYKRLKQENPLRIAYDSSKGSAKRRNKVFELTKEEYSDFCTKTNYLALKGIYKDSYHLDRIEETGGYTKDNIQILKNPDNVKKYRRFVDRQNGQAIFTTVTSKPIEFDEDCPF